MPKVTRQDRLITALGRLGYVHAPGRSTKYVEMRLGPDGRSLLKPGNEDHRVLVGPRSLRYTRGTIAQSIPFSDRTIAKLLDGAANTRITVRRHQAPAGECGYCDDEHAAGRTFHPSHDASARCESGKRSHCSCDTCF